MCRVIVSFFRFPVDFPRNFECPNYSLHSRRFFFLKKADPDGILIAAAVMKANGKLRGERQTSDFFLISLSSYPILSPQPVPWNHFLTSPTLDQFQRSSRSHCKIRLLCKLPCKVNLFVCSPIFLEIFIPFIWPQLARTYSGTDSVWQSIEADREQCTVQ